MKDSNAVKQGLEWYQESGQKEEDVSELIRVAKTIFEAKKHYQDTVGVNVSADQINVCIESGVGVGLDLSLQDLIDIAFFAIVTNEHIDEQIGRLAHEFLFQKPA